MSDMELFKRKKKAFGEKIEPSCQYCRYSSGKDAAACRYGIIGVICKKYEYDPTKRAPKGQPKMKEYDKDDFSL
jgi:hypothetical protein